jgi:murein L,D-transpeptidase YafK
MRGFTKMGRYFSAAQLFLLITFANLPGHAASSDDKLPPDVHATRVVVHKSTHTLTLFKNDQALKTYKVALGANPVAPKSQKGDHKTPEGLYVLDRRNEHSHFYKAIHISYPNADDRERARKLGVDPGGDVMVHGIQSGLGWIGSMHRKYDWTDGCIAVTDEEMDEIWRAVPDGTPIEIDP